MKKITKTSNFGRFATSLSLQVSESLTPAEEALIGEGALSVQFRAVGSKVEKELEKAKLKTESQKRSEIPYSEAARRLIDAEGQDALDSVCLEKGYPEMEFSVTGEHVYGDREASRKMAETLYGEYVKAPDASKAAFALIYGFAVDAPQAAIVEVMHAKLAGLKAPRAAKAAKNPPTVSAPSTFDADKVSDEATAAPVADEPEGSEE